MFDYINPISYNTDINTLAFAYNTGTTCGIKPYVAGNFFDGSIFNPQNLFRGFTNFNIYKLNTFNSSPLNLPNIYQQNYYNTQRTTAPLMPVFITDFNIYKLNNNSTSITPKAKTEQVTASNKTKTIKQTTTDKQTTITNNKSKTSSDIGYSLVENAKQYIGYNESDGSSKKFSDSKEWCADFVSYIVKDTYTRQGKTPPEGFDNHRVEGLKQWGIDNNKFFQIANKPNKATLIAQNIKPGDILILRENQASHTGFVTKVNADGTFETIEGNRADKVATARYSPNYKDISGFVQLT